VIDEVARLDDAALVAWTNEGVRADDFERVVAGLEELARRHPANAAVRQRLAMALNNRGARRARAGALRAAEDDMRRALDLVPDHPEALFNRARFLVAGRLWKPALEVLARLRERHPGDDEIALEHAEASAMAGTDDGDDLLVAAITRAREGGHVDRLRLSTALATLGRSAEALDALSGAASVPGALRIAAETGDRLREGDDWRAARAAFAVAAAVGDHGGRSPSLRSAIGARLALPLVHASRESLDDSRATFLAGLDDLVSTYADDRLARCEPALEQLAWTQQMLAYHGADDREPLTRWGDWLDLALRTFVPHLACEPRRSTVRDLPRIGIVSSRLYRTVIGNYFGTWIGALAAAGLPVTVFLVDTPADETTAHITAPARQVVPLAGSIESMAEAIRDADLDALLYPDVGIDPRTTLLAALRLAPRQYAGWGHPETTGLPSVDGFVSCEAMEATDAAAHYRERLLLLPGAGTQFLDPGAPAPSTRADFGLRDDDRVHLVPHVPPKLHPDCDAVFARIAASDPRAVLVFFRFDRPVVRAVLERRISAALHEAGADPSRQLRFLPYLARERFLGLCSVADTMLDTLHWSGGANTIDALRCGLPVVACPGPLMRGRQTLGMLRVIGLDGDLAAATPAAMADLATRIAGERDLRADLARRISARIDVLFDGSAALAALAQRLREDIARGGA
jgi:tetratricopeptide (TPR) repeat protein